MFIIHYILCRRNPWCICLSAVLPEIQPASKPCFTADESCVSPLKVGTLATYKFLMFPGTQRAMLFHKETGGGVVRLSVTVRFESGVTLCLRSVNSHQVRKSFRFSFKIVAYVSEVIFIVR